MSTVRTAEFALCVLNAAADLDEAQRRRDTAPRRSNALHRLRGIADAACALGVERTREAIIVPAMSWVRRNPRPAAHSPERKTWAARGIAEWMAPA